MLHATISPLALGVQATLRSSLSAPEITLGFDSLFASDLSGRARAFSNLVKSGLTLERAAALAGLLQDDEAT